jgi:hypothetical protein
LAITFVSSAEKAYSSATPVTSDTQTLDIGTRTNGLLVVGVGIRGAAVTSVNGITWNGVALAKADAITNTVPANDGRSEVWYLAAPANGSNNLVVTFSGDTTQYYIVTSWYDGAHQTQASVLDDTATGTGSTDPSVDIVPTQDNDLIVSLYISETNTPDTVGTGETLLQDHDFGAFVAGASYAIQTTAGTQTVDWTGVDDEWSMTVASFKVPAGGAAQLVVQDATLAIAADGVALTQHNVLVVADALLALAAESPTLTQHNVLVVADALLALASEAPALTQHNILVVADALLALAAETPTLTPHLEIVVQDATVALSVDNVVLVQHGVLVVQDALIGLAAENISFAGEESIVVAGSMAGPYPWRRRREEELVLA